MQNNFDKEAALKRLQQIMEGSPYQTKTEFSQALGVSPQVLGNVQNRRNTGRGIPKSILTGLSRLGYNTQWLLYGVGSQRANQTIEQEELQILREEVRLLSKLTLLRQQEKTLGIAQSERPDSSDPEAKVGAT